MTKSNSPQYNRPEWEYNNMKKTNSDSGNNSPSTDVPMKKANSYYMDNYEATITVHKSPPLQRRPFTDFLEIDDETRDDSERVYSQFTRHKLSKRKNLRVTFSDHIEIDVIEDLDDVDGVFIDETITDLSTNQGKPSRTISCDFDYNSYAKEVNSPRSTQTKPGTDIKLKANTKTSPTAQASKQAPTLQTLLPKRKVAVRSSMSELEKKTKDHIAQLEEKRKFFNPNSKFNSPRSSLLPDIGSSGKTKSSEQYKQFLSSVKRAVETSRSYDKPWLHGQTSSYVITDQQTSVKRTSSLPKNFKLPDNISPASAERFRRSSMEHPRLGGTIRTKIRNS